MQADLLILRNGTTWATLLNPVSRWYGWHLTPAISFLGCQRGKGMQSAAGAGLAIKKLGESLKHTLEELFGPTLHLSSASMELMFPTSFTRLSTIFYRSKVTSWIAAQEEDYSWTSVSNVKHCMLLMTNC